MIKPVQPIVPLDNHKKHTKQNVPVKPKSIESFAEVLNRAKSSLQ